MSNRKLFLVAALCLTGGVGAAQARDVDVQWSVTIGSPVYALPMVQVAQPAPVYLRPAPVYVQTVPAYVQPVPVYVQPARGYRHQDHYWQASRWDRDGDGIPDRYDRLYNPRWDRDGDGIPNRRDHYDNSQRGEVRGGRANHPDRYAGQGRYGN